MTEAMLEFALNLKYMQTEYGAIFDLSGKKPTKNGNGTYRWVFPLRNLPRVEALLGKKIEFRSEDTIHIRPKVSQTLHSFEKNGEDGIKVTETPNAYLMEEHRKNDEGEVETRHTEVPKSIVNVVWRVMLAYPYLSKIKSKETWHAITRALGVDARYCRNSGTFDHAKFFGERKDYMRYFYYPVKVLEHKGAVRHWKRGYVERIGDYFEQVHFEVNKA